MKLIRAVIDDLYRVEGKAELVDGSIVRLPLFGYLVATVVGNIKFSLWDYAEEQGGQALGSTVVFVVPELKSGRESFCPDAAYYTGPRPANPMKFIPGPPTFAVEVRSEGDYSPAADREMSAKRADYFEAGTLVVWDVDPIAKIVRCFRDGEAMPIVFTSGMEADAEPAVPGWRISVDGLMD